MAIAISKSESKFEKYIYWLDFFNTEYKVLDYQNHETALRDFEKCAGLILSGGVDIYPELYCDWEPKELRGTYIPERDGFELKLIERAIQRRVPILAICRGLQLMNVYFRGSLIFDLEQIRRVNHRKISQTEDRIHGVKIFDDTLLRSIAKIGEASVNSSHHQAIDRLGEGLLISAKSDDGVIEGIEYAEKYEKPFFIGVQWHPERFTDYNVSLSKDLLLKFLSECGEA